MAISETLLVVVSALSALLGATFTFVLGWKNLRNNNAGGDKLISEAWQGLIAPMQSRISEQEQQIGALKNRVDGLESLVSKSEAIITSLTGELKRERAIQDLYRAQLTANKIEPMVVLEEPKKTISG